MKKLLIFMILLLLVPIVSAVPPVQVASGDETLEMHYPPYEYVKFNQDFKLHVHVFNKTSGMPMTNDTTSCIIHLYNHSGYHILESEMGYDSNLLEFDLLINAPNFTIGQHAYILQCNTSSNGGFASGEFIVTTDGLVPEDNGYGWALITLLGGAFLFIIAAFKIDSLVLKSLFFFIAMIFVVITLSVSTTLPNDSMAVTGTLELAYLIAAVVAVFSFIFTIIIFIYEGLIGKKAEEEREREG